MPTQSTPVSWGRSLLNARVRRPWSTRQLPIYARCVSPKRRPIPSGGTGDTPENEIDHFWYFPLLWEGPAGRLIGTAYPYEEIGWPPGWIRLAKLRRPSGMQGKRVKELTCNLIPRETKLDFGL